MNEVMSDTGLADVIRPGAGRGLDFVILAELRKRTGITMPEIVKFAVSEMLCNALDTDATTITIKVGDVDGFVAVAVTDNGSKVITLDEINVILVFTRKASSKRGFLRVSRGYLGNALKCLFGYSYALATEKRMSPPRILVRSHGKEYRISLTPDKVNEIIHSDVRSSDTDDVGNAFTVRFPAEPMGAVRTRDVLRDIIFATSIVNPTRKIRYDLWGEKGETGVAKDTPVLRSDTSVIWYDESQFASLFKDFVRARPRTPLKNFVALFRGFTGTKKMREILVKMNAVNHDRETGVREFLSTTPILDVSDGDIGRLYATMRRMAKPIATVSVKKVLGIVGKPRFEEVREQNGWRRLRYHSVCSRNAKWMGQWQVSFPFIVEIALFDRQEDDPGGVKVYQCVNFMASNEDIFSKLYDLPSHMSKCGIRGDMPVTLVAHLICPVLKWLNYGKSGLYE